MLPQGMELEAMDVVYQQVRADSGAALCVLHAQSSRLLLPSGEVGEGAAAATCWRVPADGRREQGGMLALHP